MIKYKILPSNPKYLHHKYLYALKSRGTIYGVHRENLMNNFDPNCSKTSLLLFIENSHAINFKNYLDYQQKSHKKMINRIMNDCYCNSITSTSIQPLDIHKISADELKVISLMNFFNLLIINNINKNNNDISLYGYEFLTYEFPNRQMIEYQLYKSFNQSTN